MSPAAERVQPASPTATVPGLESVLATLVHASVLDGIVGATKVLTVTLLLDVKLTPAVAVVGLVAFAIYASNKLVDDEDEVNAPDRARFVARYRRELAVATTAAVVLALALAATAGTLAFALTVLPGLAAVAYSVELPVTDRRLKDVLGVNNLLVSVAWALTVVGLPLAWVGAEASAVATVAFAFYFAQTVVAFEVRNVRDVAGDRAEGVQTLPVVLGVERTRILLYGVDAAAIAIYAAATVAGVLSLPVGVAFAAATVLSVVATALVDRVRDDGRLCLLRDANYLGVLLVVALAG